MADKIENTKSKFREKLEENTQDILIGVMTLIVIAILVYGRRNGLIPQQNNSVNTEQQNKSFENVKKAKTIYLHDIINQKSH
ncbi:MAG: hypothetical protein IKZ49_04085 [Alphaproteobacteria bacterium]|nr:hypothetical protein [Alphaproteobacteria bacterium]